MLRINLNLKSNEALKQSHQITNTTMMFGDVLNETYHNVKCVRGPSRTSSRYENSGPLPSSPCVMFVESVSFQLTKI
jgi:hypothetical protein